MKSAIVVALLLGGCALFASAADHAGQACSLAERACTDYARLPAEYHRPDVDKRCAPWLRGEAAGGAGGSP